MWMRGGEESDIYIFALRDTGADMQKENISCMSTQHQQTAGMILKYELYKLWMV